MKSQKLNLKKAYVSVKNCRDIITPNPGFVRQLLAYEKVLFPEPQEDFMVYYFRTYNKLGPTILDEQISCALAEANGNLSDALYWLI